MGPVIDFRRIVAGIRDAYDTTRSPAPRVKSISVMEAVSETIRLVIIACFKSVIVAGMTAASVRDIQLC